MPPSTVPNPTAAAPDQVASAAARVPGPVGALSPAVPRCPDCRLCGAARWPGVDQCARCGASDLEFRRWRRRNDARWRALIRLLQTRLFECVAAIVLWFIYLVYFMQPIAEAMYRYGGPLADAMNWGRGALTIVPRTLLVVLLFAIGIRTDLALRRVPTWGTPASLLPPWFPVGLCLMTFVTWQWSPRGSNVVAGTYLAVSPVFLFFAAAKLAGMTRSLDQWVLVDRQAVAISCGRPLPQLSLWRRTRPLRVMLVGLLIASALLYRFAPYIHDSNFIYGTELTGGYLMVWVILLFIGVACWLAQFHALIRALRRWSRA